MKILSDQKGFSYILTCAVILCIALFLSAMIQYGYVYHAVKEQQDNIQLQLDGYMTRNSIAYYDALKQGEPYEDYIDRSQLIGGAYTVLGFPELTTLEYKKEAADGQTVYTMSRPDIAAITGGSVGISIKYQLTVPYVLFGRKIADIHVPVEMVSKLTEK